MLHLKPIPYRIWDKIDKSFCGVRPYPTEDGSYDIEEPDNVDNDRRYLISYQTPDKDKNHKSVFVGDILKWKCAITGLDNFALVIDFDRAALFEKNKFYYWDSLYGIYLSSNNTYKIIGNIFENIDLIKDEEFKQQILEQLK